MTELALVDVGGSEIDPRELITDELIGYVENLNPSLGKEGDPYFSEYRAFLEEINAAGIATIDPEAMSTGRFDDIDLSGNDVEVKDVADEAFVLDNDRLLVAATMLSIFDMPEGAEFLFADEFVNPFGDLVSMSS
jgi:hypothetical protein